MKPKYYSGVGARETPLAVLILMAKFANIMERKGYILRSGCAIGADSAFEFGLENHLNSEIYIPYKGFLNTMKRDNQDSPAYIVPELFNKQKYYDANMLIDQNNLHPAWGQNLKDWLRKLHNRNVFQVLGKNLDLKEKSKFTLCYTKDGVRERSKTTYNTGGTGTAIRVSGWAGVPTFNMGNKEDRERIEIFIDSNLDLLNIGHINKTILFSDYNPKKLTIEQLLNNQNNLEYDLEFNDKVRVKKTYGKRKFE